MKARVLAVDIRATPRLAIALVVLAAALAFSIYSTSPPDPNPFSPGWNLSSLSGSSFVSGLDTILYTFLPVRSFLDAEYWSHTDTFWRDHHAFVLPVSIALGLVLALSLAPRWSHVIAFVMTGVLIVAFQLARYPGAMRHWGHLFMLLIALTWIGRLVAPRRRHVLSSVLLVAIGLFQAESFLAAAWRDRSDAFAAGKATADFIRQAGLQDLPIVAGPAYFVLPVTGYLDRPFISSESEEVSQTVVFHNRKREFSEATLLAFAADVAKRKHSPVLVVSDRPLHAELAKGAKLSPLYHYPGVLCMTNERFFVYKLQL
jgi:hypothetical protein